MANNSAQVLARSIGDIIALEDNGSGVAGLGPVDGSRLTGLPAVGNSNVFTGLTTWVDSFNGNDGTGLRGRQSSPFATISAALAVALSGDVVYVLPGVYNVNATQLTVPAGVSLLGIDRRRCQITYTGAATVTLVTLNANALFTNFDILPQPSGGTTTCIGVTDATAAAFRVNVNSSLSGNVVGANFSATNAVGTGRANFKECVLLSNGGANAGLLVSGAGGTCGLTSSVLDGVVGASLTAGTLRVLASRIGGTTGLQTAVGTSAVLDRATTVTTFALAANTLTLDSFYVVRDNFAATVDPAASNDNTQGYAPGSRWVNTTAQRVWSCVSAATGAAVWAPAGSTNGGLVQSQWVEVTTNLTTTAATWPQGSTTVGVAVTLPAATITVIATTSFPTSGQLVCFTNTGAITIVSYTGKTGGSFTGCSGGSGTLGVGNFIFGYTSTTIAAGSNGVALPTGTINVGSTTNFPVSGQALIVTTNGPQLVTYTNTNATQLLGASGGTGTLATGNSVINVSATAQDFLTVDITTTGGPLVLQFAGTLQNGTNNSQVFAQILVDGQVKRGASTKSNGGSPPGSVVVGLKVSGLAAGAHRVVARWRVDSGTASIAPLTNENQSASLLVQEVFS